MIEEKIPRYHEKINDKNDKMIKTIKKKKSYSKTNILIKKKL
jgi:hypothetical protein